MLKRLKWWLRLLREYHDLWREYFISVVLRLMLWFQGDRK